MYLLRENPLGPGRQHTRLDFMAGRLGPGVGVRFGWVAAQGAGFAAFGVGQGGRGRGAAGEREAVRASWGPPERLQHLGAAAAGAGRAGRGRLRSVGARRHSPLARWRWQPRAREKAPACLGQQAPR